MAALEWIGNGGGSVDPKHDSGVDTGEDPKPYRAAMLCGKREAHFEVSVQTSKCARATHV